MPSMPDPLHPAPVQLPIALAASIPILAIRWSFPAERVVVERHIEVQMSHGGGALAYAHGAASAHLDRTAARR